MMLHIASTRGLLKCLAGVTEAYVQFALMDALTELCGRVMSSKELAEHIYGSNGPLDYGQSIHVTVHLLRKRGIKIMSERYRGYYLQRAA